LRTALAEQAELARRTAAVEHSWLAASERLEAAAAGLSD
jgi:hypothetical protein